MHLASFHFDLDLDPAISLPQREKVIRSLREKIKYKFSSRIIIKPDSNNQGYHLSFFGESFNFCQSQVEAILTYAESTGECRIKNPTYQIFRWHEDRFVDTPCPSQSLDPEKSKNNEKMIVYPDEDDKFPRFSSAKSIPLRNSIEKHNS